MEENNYIERIRFFGKYHIEKREREICLAIPGPYNPYTVNILCGRNRTGKSHLLKRISKCVFKHNVKIEDNGVYTQNKITVEDVDVFAKSYTSSLGRCLYIDDVSRYVRYARSISVRLNSNFRKKAMTSRRSETGNQYLLKECLDDFLRDVFIHLPNLELDMEQWKNSDTYRNSTFEFFDLKHLYRCDTKVELVSLMNEITGASLYVAKRIEGDKNENYELYLVYNEDTTLGFSTWSEGQKVLFVTLLFILYYRPNIFFFDEIENHLHPQYISFLFKVLKKYVPQSLISTHHPHIIFSRYADTVWYLEIENPNGILPETLEKKDKNTNKAPIRKVYSLERNLDKIIYVYKLFDSYDTQLLRLSSSSIKNLNELVVDIFAKLFTYDVLESNPTEHPDLQAEKIYNFILTRLKQKKQINILEIGAGKGRVIKELNKINPQLVNKKINWHLVDPKSEPLKKEIGQLNISNIAITDDIKNVNTKMDMVLFINVLHELHPNDIAKYVYRLQTLIEPGGIVLVVELFPLLFPEKFSIPMKSVEWADFFRSLGMTVQIESINIKNSYIEAFWLKIKPDIHNRRSLDDIERTIAYFLKNRLLRDRCADYRARFEFDNMDDEIIRIMCELTSIASISSYLNEEWK